MDSALLEGLLQLFASKRHYFEAFMTSVVAHFEKEPTLSGQPPIIHSMKTRLKSEASLRDKIARKHLDEPITIGNFFTRISDFAGVRVLHLHQRQFALIHACITDRIGRGDWHLDEQPTAYTWDPESTAFFEGFGLRVEVKDSFYTSVHYVVRPRSDSEASCEIQVRTLFEEIWGEIDHQLNYPEATGNLACREQLRVLARLVGAGSRLADAIFRVHEAGR